MKHIIENQRECECLRYSFLKFFGYIKEIGIEKYVVKKLHKVGKKRKRTERLKQMIRICENALLEN